MECIGGEEEELPKRPCPSRIITARHLRAVTRTPLADITRERVFMLLCCLRHRTALPLELIFPIVYRVLGFFVHPLAKKKGCQHWCELSINRCCSCSDLRSSVDSYMEYVDGVGHTMSGGRADHYCGTCRTQIRWQNRKVGERNTKKDGSSLFLLGAEAAMWIEVLICLLASVAL
eukprot:TRINITY_DN734_c0_g2_i2.p1 TRINITY_DN734_c0_g2~~TRINITY_DN734_c0_g2_i2.p1  ORF type:complete len:175 (-),score=10.25 TRINITY_DN734_c0_g2_i2:218-742(-)